MTAYFETMIFTKSISTCDQQKMAKEILSKEIDLMIFFWLTIESFKFSLLICEFSWLKLAYASSQAAMLSYCFIKVTAP